MLHVSPSPGVHQYHMEKEKINRDTAWHYRKKSGVVGVIWQRKSQRWIAQVGRQYIGIYSTVEDAAQAIKDYKGLL